MFASALNQPVRKRAVTTRFGTIRQLLGRLLVILMLAGVVIAVWFAGLVLVSLVLVMPYWRWLGLL